MSKELVIGFTGALIGGLFSLLGSYMSIRASYTLLDKNFKNQQNVDFQRILRGHLEELHINVNNITTYLNTIYHDIDNYFEGKLSKEALKDSIDKLSEKRKYDMSRIEMIIGIYFRELKGDYENYYDTIYNYSLELNNLQSFLKESEKFDVSSKKTFIEKMSNYHDLVNETSDELIETISKEMD